MLEVALRVEAAHGLDEERSDAGVRARIELVQVRAPQVQGGGAAGAVALVALVTWPRVADPLRTLDYHNLVRFHAMRGEEDRARQWADEGVEKARALAAQIPYRVEVDASDESVGKRIRNAELDKVPFILVVGERESADSLAIRERADFDAVLKRNSNDVTALGARAAALIRDNKFVQAIADLDRVIQLDAPRSVASFLQRLGRTGRRPGSTRNMIFLATRRDSFLQAAALLPARRAAKTNIVEAIKHE